MIPDFLFQSGYTLSSVPPQSTSLVACRCGGKREDQLFVPSVIVTEAIHPVRHGNLAINTLALLL